MVFESLRERIDANPFFFTLRQMPKAISRIIVNMAKSTIGLTGAKTVIIETRKRDLVFIRVNDMPSKVECHTGCE